MENTMKCGHYGAVITKYGPIRHTYTCIEKTDGTTQWFDCWGSHSTSSSATFPAPFLKKKGYWSPPKSTNTKQYKANLSWSRAIAGNGSKSEKEIQECKAGLTYLLTGVCHQACNSVMYPIRPQGYDYGYLNSGCKIGYDTTYAYGYYGGKPYESDKDRMKKFRNLKNLKRGSATSDSLEYSQSLVQDRLDYQFDRSVFSKVLAGKYGISEGDPQIEEAVNSLERTHLRRREFERELLLGNLNSTVEAANSANELFMEDSKTLNILLSSAVYTESQPDLVTASGEATESIVNPELIQLEELSNLGSKLRF